MLQKTKSRLFNISIIFCSMLAGITIILYNLNDNIIYFYPPSEIHKLKNLNAKVRIGGLVKMDSIQIGDDQKIDFILTDNIAEIEVHYQGMLPALFRAGQGIIAEGKLVSDNKFFANSLLTKHDESYKPPVKK